MTSHRTYGNTGIGPDLNEQQHPPHHSSADFLSISPSHFAVSKVLSRALAEDTIRTTDALLSGTVTTPCVCVKLLMVRTAKRWTIRKASDERFRERDAVAWSI
jgi:hypothetical protein